MFSPRADTTFSRFFSPAVWLWAGRDSVRATGHLQHLEWLLRLAPPWKMRQGSLLLVQDGSGWRFLHWVHTTPFFSPDPGFSLVLGFSPTSQPAHCVSSGPDRLLGPDSSQSPGPGGAKEGLRVSGLFDDTVSAPTEGFWLFPRPSHFYSVQRLQSCSFPLAVEPGSWPGLGAGHGSEWGVMQE